MIKIWNNISLYFCGFNLGFRSKDRDEEEEEEWRQMETEGVRIRHIAPLTTDPSPTISFTDPSWDWLEKTTPLQTQRSEVRGGEVTEFFLPNSDLDDMQEPSQQVRLNIYIQHVHMLTHYKMCCKQSCAKQA